MQSADQSGIALPSLAFSQGEILRFHELGYAILRNVCEPHLVERMIEVTRFGLENLVEPIEFEADLKYPGAPDSTAAAGGKTVRRLKQALSRDYVFTEWVQHPAIVLRLRQLLGSQIVCPLAHHNCIMTKEPRFSSDTGWHQDLRYWSFARPDLISVWLALGPERKENGCLQLIPGSHRQTYPASSFDKELFFRSDLPENEEVLQNRVLAELNPGDVLFFHAKTLHAATRNYSSLTKYSVVFTFRAIDNPPTPGSRSEASPEMLLH
ncbi:phytanoyl-CoA dioxygenase family protein [Planctomicrobium sp. SH661]|uniref:phytanoyl-CoA dioxygenase family protein n=1 Tax=Planctomicrobium sp. SH661 TaxID=3448124 RepID=UPI003F5BD750